jgi:imidazolonepropionase
MRTLLTEVRLATMTSGAVPMRDAREQAILFEHGRIAWIGEVASAPGADETVPCNGGWLTPGFVDCHTHLVHGGNRAHEFVQRLEGATYEAIARAGGGILSTVAATRSASEQALVDSALPRLSALAAEGVTTVEIKSGYGLDVDNELKMLRVARRLGELVPVTVRTTLLALHALPPEFRGRADAYVDYVCAELIPATAQAGLADAVDAFCDRIAFTRDQCERAFDVAQAHGLPVKLHAEQLSNQHGASLVARLRGLSADHLEYLDEAGAAALAQAGVVAVLLPGAYLFLQAAQRPPVALLRQHGVPIALASDNNPGSSPYASLLLMLHLGCTLFGLTPEEALAAVTREGARALGMQATHGTLEVGKMADALLWHVDDPAELAYSVGVHRPAAIFRHGASVHR